MRNQVIGILAAGAVLFSTACTEKGPTIDLTVKSGESTTLLANPEEPQPRNILIEEATGVKCPNCPAGAKILKTAADANEGRVIIVGLHANNQTKPLGESKYDFRQDDLILPLFNAFGGEPNKPAAMFDRVKQGTAFFLDNRSAWPGVISQRLQLASPVRLSISSSYNPATREDTIRIRVSYTSEVAKKQSIGILITENNIVDAQEDDLIIVEDYDHEHVFRDFVTPYNGVSFLDTLAIKEPGRVYERTFVYKVPERAFGEEKFKWNLDNCKIIGFVMNNESGNYEVSQAIEIPFK